MGDYYLTGTFNSSQTNFYDSNGYTESSLPNTATNDIYIVKYASNGAFSWARKIGGTGTDNPISMVTDNENDVYVTGYFDNTLNFYNENAVNPVYSLMNSVSTDTFVVKYKWYGDFAWVIQIGGTGVDKPVSMVTDNANIYVTGSFIGLLNFYNSTGGIDVSLTNMGNTDTFIAKYNSLDGTLLWARKIGRSGTDIPVSIEIDNTNIYVTGYFNNTLDFYDSSQNSILSFIGTGSTDIYIAKYDLSGNVLWGRTIGGNDGEKPVSMVIYNKNVYVTSYYYQKINFYDSSRNIVKSFQNDTVYADSYIAKYDQNGTFSWASKIEGTGEDYPVKMVTDNANIYITGTFGDFIVNFYNSSDSIVKSLGKNTIYTPPNTYIAKYDSSGNVLWASQIGGTGGQYPVSIVTDSANIYIAGYSDDTGSNNAFIARYDSSNGTSLWQREIGGSGTDDPVSILTYNGNIYVTGYFNNILNFYDSTRNPIISLDIIGIYNTYIAKYDKEGIFSWAKRIGGDNPTSQNYKNTFPINACVTLVDPPKYIYYNLSTGILSWESSSLLFIVSNGTIDVSSNVNSINLSDYFSPGTSTYTIQSIYQLNRSNPVTTESITLLAAPTGISYIPSTGILSWDSSFSSFIVSDGTIDVSSNVKSINLSNNFTSGTKTYTIKAKDGTNISKAAMSGLITLLNAPTNVFYNPETYLLSWDSSYSSFIISNGTIDVSSNVKSINLLNNFTSGTKTYTIKATDGTNISIPALSESIILIAAPTDVSYNTQTGILSWSSSYSSFIVSNGSIDVSSNVKSMNLLNVFSSGTKTYTIKAKDGTNIGKAATSGSITLLATPRDVSYNSTTSVLSWDSSASSFIISNGTIYVLTNVKSINLLNNFISGTATYSIKATDGINISNPATSGSITIIIEDITGSYYITGYFDSVTYSFYDPNQVIVKSFNKQEMLDIYIAKYTPYGTLLWASQIGQGSTNDKLISMVTDNKNIYITGYFVSPNLKFYNNINGATTTLNNKGSNDTYIAKYDISGAVVWVSQIAGLSDDKPVSMVINNTNIYITGSYSSSSLIFYDPNGTQKSFGNSGSTDTYIAKYDLDGILLWVTTIGGNLIDQPVSIVTDNTNIYITGSFTSSTLSFYDIDKNPLIWAALTNKGSSDTFIAKYDKNGTLSWVRQIGGTQLELPVSIVTDNTNVYITGHFTTSFAQLNFFNSTGVSVLAMTNRGSTDTYIAKYDPYGTLLWARQIGGTGAEFPISIVTDNRNVYITGSYTTGAIYYDDKVLYRQGATNTTDTYIGKFDEFGTLVWLNGIGGTGADLPVSMVTDNKNVYVTGHGASPKFYNSREGIVTSLTNRGAATDTYMAKYDEFGTFSWVIQIGGLGDDKPVKLVTDNTNIYLTGTFNNINLDFYNIYGLKVKSLTNRGGNEMYIAKYDEFGTLLWTTQNGGAGGDSPNTACVNLLSPPRDVSYNPSTGLLSWDSSYSLFTVSDGSNKVITSIKSLNLLDNLNVFTPGTKFYTISATDRINITNPTLSESITLLAAPKDVSYNTQTGLLSWDSSASLFIVSDGLNIVETSIKSINLSDYLNVFTPGTKTYTIKVTDGTNISKEASSGSITLLAAPTDVSYNTQTGILSWDSSFSSFIVSDGSREVTSSIKSINLSDNLNVFTPGTKTYTIKGTDGTNISKSASAGSITLLAAPIDISYNRQTGVLSWDSSFSSFIVSDGSIDVLSNIKSINLSDYLNLFSAGTKTYTIKATNGSNIGKATSAGSITLLAAPTDVSYNTQTGILSWDSSFSSFIVSDGSREVTSSIKSINLLDNLNVFTPGTKTYTIKATNGSNIGKATSAGSITLLAAPTDVSYNTQTGLLSWDSSFSSFIVSDGSNTVISSIKSINLLDNLNVFTPGTKTYTIKATDETNRSKAASVGSITLLATPTDVSYNTQTGILTWISSYSSFIVSNGTIEVSSNDTSMNLLNKFTPGTAPVRYTIKATDEFDNRSNPLTSGVITLLSTPTDISYNTQTGILSWNSSSSSFIVSNGTIEVSSNDTSMNLLNKFTPGTAPVRYTIQATDASNNRSNPLISGIITLLSTPTDVSYNRQTGILSWNSSYSSFIVSNGTIEVSSNDTSMNLLNKFTPGTAPVRYTIKATDEFDNRSNPLTSGVITLLSTPTDISYNTQTGILSWNSSSSSFIVSNGTIEVSSNDTSMNLLNKFTTGTAPVRYTIQATDASNNRSNPLTSGIITLLPAPTNILYDRETGILSWNSSYSSFIVSNGTIDVSSNDTSMNLLNKFTTGTAPVRYTIQATDASNNRSNPLTSGLITLISTPTNVSYIPSTGILSWNSSYSSFIVSNGTIEVSSNDTSMNLLNKFTTGTAPVRYTIQATDASNNRSNPLTSGVITLLSTPTDVSYNTQTGILSWNSSYSSFIVSNGTIDVSSNDTSMNLLNKFTTGTAPVRYTIQATDASNNRSNPLTSGLITLISTPTNVSYIPSTGILSWNSSYSSFIVSNGTIEVSSNDTSMNLLNKFTTGTAPVRYTIQATDASNNRSNPLTSGVITLLSTPTDVSYNTQTGILSWNSSYSSFIVSNGTIEVSSNDTSMNLLNKFDSGTRTYTIKATDASNNRSNPLTSGVITLLSTPTDVSYNTQTGILTWNSSYSSFIVSNGTIEVSSNDTSMNLLDKFTTGNAAVRYTIQATDQFGNISNPLISGLITLLSRPTGVSYNPATGLLSWASSLSSFIVSNGSRDVSTNDTSMNVLNNFIPGTGPTTYTIQAIDQFDNRSNPASSGSISLLATPTDVSYNTQTGILSWNSSYSSFIVSNGIVDVSSNVKSMNLLDKFTTGNAAVRYTIQATDQFGNISNPLISGLITLLSRPTGVSYNPATGLLSWASSLSSFIVSNGSRDVSTNDTSMNVLNNFIPGTGPTTYTIQAIDQFDNRSNPASSGSISLLATPTDVSYNTQTGILSWNSSYSSFIVSNGTIDVSSNDTSMNLLNKFTTGTAPVRYTIQATDASNNRSNPLTSGVITLLSTPTDVSYNTHTGILSWASLSSSFIISNGTRDVSSNIKSINLLDKFTTGNADVRYTIQATDQFGNISNPLISGLITLLSRPTGVSYNTATGLLSWASSLSSFIVSNGTKEVSTNDTSMNLLNNFTPGTTPVTYTIKATDGTNRSNPITSGIITLIATPTDISYNPATGLLSWASSSPSFIVSNGSNNITVSVKSINLLNNLNVFTPGTKTYTIKATDGTNISNPLISGSITLLAAPTDVSYNPATGLLSWISLSPSFIISDGSNNIQANDISINLLNNLNVFSPGTKTYTIKATDRTNISNPSIPKLITLLAAPTDVSYNPATGILSWASSSPSFIVSNGAIDVSTNDTSMNLLDNFTTGTSIYTIKATDRTNISNPVISTSITLIDPPTYISYTPATGILLWDSSYSSFIVSDGTRDVSSNVKSMNLLDNFTAGIGPTNYRIKSTDLINISNPLITGLITLLAPPTDVSYNPETGILSWASSSPSFIVSNGSRDVSTNDTSMNLLNNFTAGTGPTYYTIKATDRTNISNPLTSTLITLLAPPTDVSYNPATGILSWASSSPSFIVSNGIRDVSTNFLSINLLDNFTAGNGPTNYTIKATDEINISNSVISVSITLLATPTDISYNAVTHILTWVSSSPSFIVSNGQINITTNNKSINLLDNFTSGTVSYTIKATDGTNISNPATSNSITLLLALTKLSYNPATAILSWDSSYSLFLITNGARDVSTNVTNINLLDNFTSGTGPTRYSITATDGINITDTTISNLITLLSPPSDVFYSPSIRQLSWTSSSPLFIVSNGKTNVRNNSVSINLLDYFTPGTSNYTIRASDGINISKPLMTRSINLVAAPTKLQLYKPVYNFQQNDISRKTLISKIINTGKSINYANSLTAHIYNTILSADYDANKKILLLLKHKLYTTYMNHLVTYGRYNTNEIILNYENILANLTTDEYNSVFQINVTVDVITNEIQQEITKTFYVVVDSNNQFFLIQNYNGDFFRMNSSYEFNLEHPSNLNTKFSLSYKENNTPINGLIYNGVPGTPGAKLIFNVKPTLNYTVFTFNSLSNNPYSWGYGQSILPLIEQNKVIHLNTSYIPISLQSKTNLSIYHNNGLRFYIQTSGIPFFTTSSLNYNYLVYYGTYYLEVPEIYSLALLNKGQETNIFYNGDRTKCSISDIYETTNDGTYKFFHDTLIISVYDSFTPISLYSKLYGYLGASNIIRFDSNASSFAQPEIRTDHPNIDGIEKVYGQTKVYVDYSNNSITLNNNSTISTSKSYGIYNGTYIFYTTEYIAFLINGKENIFIVSGTNSINGPGPDGIINVSFYSGIIQVKIIGKFFKMSMYTFNKGYCGGYGMLKYDTSFNNYLPHSYDFTDLSNNKFNDPEPIVYNQFIPLNTTILDFKVDGSSFGKPLDSYNIIQSDNSGNLILNNYPYNRTTQYTMTKNKTYVFYNISNSYITFMTNRKESYVISSGDNTGIYYTIESSPNGEKYTFNISERTSIAFLKPIIVKVTGDFGYLSICTLKGYNGGQNLISYSNT